MIRITTLYLILIFGSAQATYAASDAEQKIIGIITNRFYSISSSARYDNLQNKRAAAVCLDFQALIPYYAVLNTGYGWGWISARSAEESAIQGCDKFRWKKGYDCKCVILLSGHRNVLELPDDVLKRWGEE